MILRNAKVLNAPQEDGGDIDMILGELDQKFVREALLAPPRQPDEESDDDASGCCIVC